MSSNTLISIIIMIIFNDKNHIKTRKNGCLEIDILTRTLHIVVSTKNGICGSKNTGSRVQNRCDTGLCNRNCLLLHGFVNSDTIFVSHFVKLINTHNTTIGQNHGTTFQIELTGSRVSLNWSCQTSCRGALTGCINSNWRHLLDKLQQLRFSSTRITQHKNIDITTKSHTIW